MEIYMYSKSKQSSGKLIMTRFLVFAISKLLITHPSIHISHLSEFATLLVVLNFSHKIPILKLLAIQQFYSNLVSLHLFRFIQNLILMSVSNIHHYDPMKSSTTVAFITSLASSLISKTISTTINAPLNFIQNRYQVMAQMKRNGLIQQNYKGYADCLKSALKQQKGILSLWKGNLAKIIMGYSGMLFSLTAGSYAKKIMTLNSQQPFYNQFFHSRYFGSLAGMISSLGSIFITYPFQYAYIRLLTDKQTSSINKKKQFNGIFHVLSQTLKSDGIRGIYRGILTSFAAIALYRVSYFGLYDLWKNSLIQQRQSPSIVATFVAGYIITLAASAITYPANTVRKRMMMRSLELEKYKWSGQCFTTVVKNQGFSALYRGYPIALLTAISGSFMLMAYDNLLSAVNLS